jgi:hypothetical protein
MKYTVVLSKERINELYGPLGRATPTLRDPNQFTWGTMRKWCDDNVEGYEILNPRTWIFLRHQDAMMFMMVWG